MEISAQNTPLLPLSSPLSSPRSSLSSESRQPPDFFIFLGGGGIRFLADRCQHVKNTQREWWGAEVARQGFYSFLGGRRRVKQVLTTKETIIYLFACLFICG